MVSPPPPTPRPARSSARLPALLILLAIPSLCIGLLGLFLGSAELSGALPGRGAAVEGMRDAQLRLYDSKRLVPTLQQLPRQEVERLSLMLGDERYERRGVTVSMALLGLLSSWLLLAGALGTLRRQPGALPLWRWACMVNIPLTILSIVVTVVQGRELMERLGPPLADALAKVSKRGAAAELSELWAFYRLYVMAWAVFYGAWVLWLGLTVLGLRRYAQVEREA